VGPIAILDAVVKRKIPSPRRESNPRTPIVQPVDLKKCNRQKFKQTIQEQLMNLLKTLTELIL